MAEDLHRIELRSSNLDDLRSYLDGAAVTFGCRPVARQEGVEYVVNVYAPVGDIERLRFARNVPGVTMNVLENTAEIGRTWQRRVRTGNLFANRTAPTGLGIKE